MRKFNVIRLPGNDAKWYGFIGALSISKLLKNSDDVFGSRRARLQLIVKLFARKKKGV